jgi:hypothetical protein
VLSEQYFDICCNKIKILAFVISSLGGTGRSASGSGLLTPGMASPEATENEFGHWGSMKNEKRRGFNTTHSDINIAPQLTAQPTAVTFEETVF